MKIVASGLLKRNLQVILKFRQFFFILSVSIFIIG